MHKATIHPEMIQAMLGKCTWDSVQSGNTTSTLVNVFTEHGFYLATGHSACIDPANYDPVKGREIAQHDALHKADEQLYRLESYAILRDARRGRYELTLEDMAQPLWLQRLIIETAEQQSRYDKLVGFLDIGCPGVIDEVEVDELTAQANAQKVLLDILVGRLARGRKQVEADKAVAPLLD